MRAYLLIYLFVAMTRGQQTPVQSCEQSNDDTRCLIDYIAYQRAPETHLLQQIHAETRQIVAETRDMSQRLQNLRCPSTSSDSSSPTVPSIVSGSTNQPENAIDTKRPRDCRDIQLEGNTFNGVYTIYPYLTNRSIEVYCDLFEEGGGWIVFQRRRDGSVSFNRDWNDYRDGFGVLMGELWLGNRFIHDITEHKGQELRIELGDWAGSRAYAKYSRFHVSSEATNFTLYLGTYSGNAGNSFGYGSYHNHQKFSTRDRDNDGYSSHNCASLFSAGFWHGPCALASYYDKIVSLNGPYSASSSVTSPAYGITYYSWKNSYQYSLRFVEMKMRPILYNST